MAGVSGDVYPEKEEKAKKQGKDAGDRAMDGFISGLADAAQAAGEALVMGDWDGVKNALGNALSHALRSIVTGAFSSMGPVGGIIGGFFGGVIDGLTKKWFGGDKKPVVQKIIEPVTVRPDKLSVTLGANPASAIFSGRARATGAGFHVEIDYRNGTGDIIAAKVASTLADFNAMQPYGSLA